MKLVCNEFNDFYINVGPSLAEKIPKQDIPPCQFHGIQSLYLEPLAEIEVKLGTPGYDIINSSVLKWTVDLISEPPCYICNVSLQQGVFPDEMEIANVIPL